MAFKFNPSLSYIPYIFDFISDFLTVWHLSIFVFKGVDNKNTTNLSNMCLVLSHNLSNISCCLQLANYWICYLNRLESSWFCLQLVAFQPQRVLAGRCQASATRPWARPPPSGTGACGRPRSWRSARAVGTTWWPFLLLVNVLVAKFDWMVAIFLFLGSDVLFLELIVSEDVWVPEFWSFVLRREIAGENTSRLIAVETAVRILYSHM